MNQTRFKSKATSKSAKKKMYDPANVPLMTIEHETKLMEALLNNRAVQLQVMKENDVYKNFKPPDLPVTFGLSFR